MANIQSLSFLKRARRGISNLLFDDDEEERSPLRSIKADPVVTDGDSTEVDEQLDDARQGYLQSLSNQKVKDISRFLADDPEKPEFDEERNKNLKNLSKVNVIASFVDALSQAIPRATSDASDQPTTVTPRSNQLGMNALDLLMQQDVNYSKKMDQFINELRQTKQFNKQMRYENENRNKQIDTQVAGAELDIAANEQALLAAQEEIKREENKSDEEAWEELSFRLASNGQPEAAVQAMISSGKDEKQARSIVEKMRKGKGDGTGEDSEITPQQLNMARRYKKLSDQIDQEGASGMHYGADGKPMSAAAKEAERIQDMLGENFYSDEVMEVLEGTSQGEGEGAQSMISPRNQQAMQSTEFEDIAQQTKEFENSPQGQAQRNRELVQKIQNASSDVEAKRALASWVESMRKQGFDEPKIRERYLKLTGAKEDSGEAAAGASESAKPSGEGQQQEPPAEEQADTAEQEPTKDQPLQDMTFEQLKQQYEAGEVSLEQIRQVSPWLARVIEAGRELVPGMKVSDFFSGIGQKMQKASKKESTVKGRYE